MNVLSLFDGMSCGQIALDNLGIKVDNYFASEIKKHAIQCTKDNFPNTKHIGDVTKKYTMLSIAKNLVLQSIEANNWKPIVDAVKKWKRETLKNKRHSLRELKTTASKPVWYNVG